jgi:hypothetical protein
MHTNLSPQHVAACTLVAPLVAFSLTSLIGFGVTASVAQQATPAPQIWTVPEIGALPDDDTFDHAPLGQPLAAPASCRPTVR